MLSREMLDRHFVVFCTEREAKVSRDRKQKHVCLFIYLFS